MHKSLIDTDILSEYLKGFDVGVRLRAARYAEVFGSFTLSMVTVYEILYGLQVKSASAQLERARNWLECNECILPTEVDYHTAAAIKAKARRTGAVVELPDCLIAASAIRLDLTLVTGNTEDFSAIQRTGVPLADRELARRLSHRQPS